ncbi:Uncharacterised protein [Mycobacteroides abscessus subsp. abscessus]|nr:Uncharacterised protein [Mycobacteroides abscessus subsp. abscessus]
MSMSGRVERSVDRNRSKTSPYSRGSTTEIPSRWLTREETPEPRAAWRMPSPPMSRETWATVRK